MAQVFHSRHWMICSPRSKEELEIVVEYIHLKFLLILFAVVPAYQTVTQDLPLPFTHGNTNATRKWVAFFIERLRKYRHLWAVFSTYVQFKASPEHRSGAPGCTAADRWNHQTERTRQHGWCRSSNTHRTAWLSHPLAEAAHCRSKVYRRGRLQRTDAE